MRISDWSSDVCSSDLCFDNSSGSRYSYLTTATDAPINDADLTDGYTIETFVKMDADWDAAANGWSKFLTRTGNRSQMPGVPRSEERRVGKEWVSTFRTRCAPYN